MYEVFFFFFQAEDGIRDAQESRGLGDVYKRQAQRRVARACRIEDERAIVGEAVAVDVAPHHRRVRQSGLYVAVKEEPRPAARAARPEDRLEGELMPRVEIAATPCDAPGISKRRAVEAALLRARAREHVPEARIPEIETDVSE